MAVPVLEGFGVCLSASFGQVVLHYRLEVDAKNKPGDVLGYVRNFRKM